MNENDNQRKSVESIETVIEEIKGLNINAAERINKIVSLIFENGILEPTSPNIYAQLCCKVQMQNVDSEDSGNNFKKAMITRCQTEFQIHVDADDTTVAKKLRPFLQKIEEATDPDDKADCLANYESEESKLKRRSVGIVRFIGELFQCGWLTPNIMMLCVETLLDRNSQNKLEFLCELLTIIGFRLESCKIHFRYHDLGKHFDTLKEIAGNNNQNVKISSRVKFMIQDVIDLRENNWIPRIQIKTVQIETKTDAERNSIRLAKYNQSSDSKIGSLGGGLNCNHSVGSKRGDRGGSSYQNNNREHFPQKSQFKKGTGRITSGTLFPFWSEDSDVPPASTQSTSILEGTSRNNRRNDSTHNSARPETRSSEESNRSQKTTVPDDIDQESRKYLWQMVRELYNSSVATHQTSTNRIFAGQVVCNWINQKLITVNDNFRALKGFVVSVLDWDTPMIWVYIAEFITPAIKQNFLSLKQIGGICNDEYVMKQILQHLIPYLMMEHGPQFVRNLFKECEWSDLISANDVSKFIREHKFEFVKDNTVIVRRTATGPTNIDLIQTRVKEFLNDSADLCVIQEFIAVNLAQTDMEFIRALTTIVIEFLMEDKTFKFSEKQYIAGLALLTSYIGDNIDLQLQCLNAIQILMNKVAYPNKHAILIIFTRLYVDQVVSEDVFHMWRDSTEILEGKSEAVSNLLKFFKLFEQEDTPEKESQ